MSELSIKDLFLIVLRKWWIILLCMIFSAGSAYLWTEYYTIPIYRANTTLYVGKNLDSPGINTVELSLGQLLIGDYQQIAKSRTVANTVISELGLTNISPQTLTNMINVSSVSGTRIVEISVRHPDPEMAYILTNKVADVFQKTVIDIMKIENVQIIDKAEYPTYPVSPNTSRNLKIGLIIGFALGIGIILLIEYLDNTIKTPEDIKNHLNLPVLGTIPDFKTYKKGI